MESGREAAQDPRVSLIEALGNSFRGSRGSAAERRVITTWLAEQPDLCIEAILRAIGEDPSREGLKNTPGRVVRSWEELFSGYGRTAEDIFTPGSDQGFDCESYDQMVTLVDIQFHSTCEHHMLPFIGVAHVAYLPNDRLLGVSKLARLVELHARRLQNQERIANAVADDLMEVSKAKGCGVVLVARHHCMACRGVKQDKPRMVTTALRGVFHEPSAKQEFLTPLWNGNHI